MRAASALTPPIIGQCLLSCPNTNCCFLSVQQKGWGCIFKQPDAINNSHIPSTDNMHVSVISSSQSMTAFCIRYIIERQFPLCPKVKEIYEISTATTACTVGATICKHPVILGQLQKSIILLQKRHKTNLEPYTFFLFVSGFLQLFVIQFEKTQRAVRP